MSTTIDDVVRLRMTDPGAIAATLAARPRFGGVSSEKNLLVIAADHPARGALGAGGNPLAMTDRRDLLDRVVTALGRPGVQGLLLYPVGDDVAKAVDDAVSLL